MSLIAFDTSILIHHTKDHPEFGQAATDLLGTLSSGKNRGIISVIALTEFLTLGSSHKKRPKTLQKALAHKLRNWLLKIPNLSIINVDTHIATEAAIIRQEYGFKTPDALHLATAKLMDAKIFYTNDKQLLKFKEVKVKLI